MKLTTTMQVSVDGVVQGCGGRDEDRSGGFERGGSAMGLFDNEAMTFVNEVFQRPDAFLFGLRTCELFAGYWGVREDLGHPIVGALNTRSKYVASTTFTDPRWADTTVLPGELAAAIGEAKPGGELQVHGCGTLADDHGDDEQVHLVDEVVLEQPPDISALRMVDARAFGPG